MRYLSVCSGIEAASVAWHDMGWQPVAFSEIEPFPSAVLKHRFPHVPNWGDMTKFQSWPDATINLLVGGTPCQSFSVAGLRQGLKDPRGNLMLTFLAIAERYKPKWIVWENVPGVLSSNGGKDFGSFLGALGELGYGWAFRVLDAAWFGVAQRRRRVFVVGCLGDQRSAAKVLFESESVSRHPAPSREKGKAVAGATEDGVGSGSQWMSPNGADTVGTLRDRDYKGPSTDSIHEGRGLAISTWWNGDQTASTVTTRSGGQYMPDKDNFGAVLTPTVIDRSAMNAGFDFDQGDVRAVNVVLEPIAVDTFNEHTSQTLGSSASDVNHYGAVMMPPMAIRRLTPLECERLQGFPELKKITTFTIWLDHQNGCVNVEIKCRSERINAYHVEEKEKQESVLSAQENSNKNQVKNKNVAGLNVLLSYEPRVVEQHNLKKSLSNVLNVEQKNLFLQLIQQENFARQVAGINTMLEKEIGTGKEALQLNTMHFTRENNGRLHALLFGQEKEVSVNDVENTIKEITTYITSNLGQNTQNLNTNYQTWLCFVLNVIALFTHEKTNQKILFEISNQVGWTLIPWKNKPIEDCPDGPRYKACGNSMAVPCMRWIGQRINDAKTEIL